MPYLLARHGVRDYRHWRALSAGMHVLQGFRDPGDADVAVFLFEVENRARAETLMSRPGGEKVTAEAGVQLPFGIHWLGK